jgi:hypothetical protein
MVNDFAELIFIFQIAVGTICVEDVCVSVMCNVCADVRYMHMTSIYLRSLMSLMLIYEL